VDAIKKHLPWRNKLSIALDCWTATDKLAIASVAGYYMDLSWVLQEVQLSFNKVDSHFFSYFESYLSITGQESTYWSTASHTFEGSSGSF